jgi:hypothetical protein
MTLILATPLVALATALQLEQLAIATKAIQALPLAQRLAALKAATGEIQPYLRKRYPSPLTPTLDVASFAPRLTLGALASWDLGPAKLVQDYVITWGSGASYTLTTSAGAAGATPGPSLPWTGSLLTDGYLLTVAWPIAPGDTYGWSTAVVQDPGIALAVARIAAHIALSARGVDALTKEQLVAAYTAGMAWAQALGIPGEGELDRSLDTNPIAGGSYGPLGSGQTRADAWLYGDNPHD